MDRLFFCDIIYFFRNSFFRLQLWHPSHVLLRGLNIMTILNITYPLAAAIIR